MQHDDLKRSRRQAKIRAAEDRPYRGQSADSLLSSMRDAAPARRTEIARTLLYSTFDRPPERSEQQRLFLGMMEIDGLPLSDRLNLHAAAAHKCLERRDSAALAELRPRLNRAFDDASGLSHHLELRQNRVHVGSSLGYVLLMAHLHGDAGGFDDAAAKVTGFVDALRPADLRPTFYRSAANICKCLGLIGARAQRGDATDRCEAAARRAWQTLALAMEARALRGPLFPISRALRPARLAGPGRLAEETPDNAFEEYSRGHRILAALRQCLDGQRDPQARAAAADEALRESVSHAHEGEAEDLMARFDRLFPRAEAAGDQTIRPQRS